MKIAWKKLKSKIIHKNPWYRIREEDVLRPDGKKGKYFIVDTGDSAYVIAEDQEKKLYLVGQSRYAVNDYVLEFVSGGLRRKTPIETAKKELLEEAGITAKKWTFLGTIYPLTGVLSEKMHIFLARDLKKGEQQLEVTEDIKIRKYNIQEIKDMIKKGDILDGQTIAAFYKYLLFKNNKK